MRTCLLLAAVCAAVSWAPEALADTKAECLAAADQGQALRDDGKYSKARDAFATCSREVCPTVVARLCTQWLRQVDDSMPTVVPGAKDEAGMDLPNAHVTLDGEPLTDSLDGKPQPVDPGEHALRFTQSGFVPTETRVVVRVGEKNRTVVVVLHPVASAPLAPKESGTVSIFNARNLTATTLAVVGAGALIGGGIFVSQSGNESGTASRLRGGIAPDYCTVNPSTPTCTQLKNAVDAEHRDTTIGVSMLVGGGVLLAGSAIAWLVWPTSADEKKNVRLMPELSPRSAAFSMGGSF